MKRLSFLLLAIILLLSSALAEPITYSGNTIAFDISAMSTNDLKALVQALDPAYAEYQRIETMVFQELSKRGEIVWISTFKSTAAKETAAPTKKPNQAKSQVNGVFVPDFQYFMENFFTYAQHIDKKMTDDFIEECKDGDKWVDHEAYSLYGGYDGITIRIDERNGYLYTFSVTVTKRSYENQKESFKEYIRAAARAILPHESDMFFGKLFDTIYYDYVLESPAGYISMYNNFDVYLATLTKTSSEISLDFTLLLRESE